MLDLLYYKHSYLDPHKYITYDFKNATVDSTRHVILKSDNNLDHTNISYKIQSLSHDKYMLGTKGKPLLEGVGSVCIDNVFYIPSYTNFYHTMVDGVPRLWGFNDSSFTVAVADTITTFNGLYSAVLNYVGASNLVVYKTDKAISNYSSNNRLTAKTMRIFSSDSTESRLINRRLAVAFWQKYADSNWGPSLHSRKLFIPRLSGRDIRCINQDEVYEFLSKNYGFEYWNTDAHSFNESAKAFRDATTIVGVHGAALSHVCFCRPGAQVYQLSGKCKSELYYKYLCDVGNVKCCSIYGRIGNGCTAKANSHIQFSVHKEDITKELSR